MKKAMSLVLAVALFLAVKASALSVAQVGSNDTAAGQLFAISTSSPVTYTGSTVAGPGINIKRLIFAPNKVTYTAVTSVQLWDTPTGLTYVAGARALTPLINNLLPTADKPFVWDFFLSNGSDYADGVMCKGFPLLVETGTNTPNAQIQYLPGGKNVVLPGTAAGVVPH